MPKRKGFAFITEVEKEEKRKKDVYNNPPAISIDKAVNMANALKWHTWGWTKVDRCLHQGRSEQKNFKR
jgi:hypothetical protein